MGDISISVFVLQIVFLILCIAIPVGVVIIGKVKQKASLKSLLWGVLSFLAALVAYTLVWALLYATIGIPRYEVLGQNGQKGLVITWEVIRCLLETVLYMVSMWIFLRIVYKKHKELGNGMIFGVGFDLCSGVLMTALSSILSLIVIITSQGGNAASFQIFSMSISVDSLKLARWQDITYNMVTFVTLLVVLICCGRIIFLAVSKKRFTYVGISAILYFVLQIPTRMCALTNQYRTYGISDIWFWGNELVVVIVCCLVAMISVLVAYGLGRKQENQM